MVPVVVIWGVSVVHSLRRDRVSPVSSFVWANYLVRSAMSDNVRNFVDSPSVAILDKCRKDELFAIATHFQISINRNSRKEEVKRIILDHLVELKIIVLSTEGEADQIESGVSTEAAEEMAEPAYLHLKLLLL